MRQNESDRAWQCIASLTLTGWHTKKTPVDPFLKTDVQLPHPDWGLRRYRSEPEQPKAANNIFGVHSSSDGMGIRGVPYRRW